MTNGEAIGHLKTIIIFSEIDGYTDKAREALKMAIEALQERKTGKWIKRLIATEPFTIYGYECPFCEFRTATNSFNFCPNCGAKMEAKGRIKNEEAKKEG